MIRWPFRLILRGVSIERQRQAAEQLATLRLQALADGMSQGKEYVRGQNDPPPKAGDGYYSLRRYLDSVNALEKVAYPWLHTLEQRIQRREAEERADFERLEQAIGRMQA